MKRLREFTAFFPFCGLGAGAMGFLDAEVRLFNTPSRFRSIGGIDIDKEACKDFERLTGSPALHGDMHELTSDDLRRAFGPVAPDVVFSSPPCLPAGGLVVTKRGVRPISSIRSGERVLTHTGAMREVVRVGRKIHNGEMIGLRLNGTVDVQKYTPNHPIWRRKVVRRKGKRCLGDPEFVPAFEVRAGNRVGFPRGEAERGTAFGFIGNVCSTVCLTKNGVDLSGAAERSELWSLIGAYLGDGYRRPSRHEVIFCVGCVNGLKAQMVRDCLESLGLAWNEDYYGGRTNIKIRTHSMHLCAIMGCFGDGASEKDIPPTLMTLETCFLDWLIDGYRITDGSHQGRRKARNELQARWRVPSTSLPLLRSVQRLLLRRAIFAKINKAWPGGKQTIMGREVNTLPRWEICVAEDPKKRTVFEFDNTHVWVRVREVTSETVKDEEVWNLEVEEDNTFCSPMITTHNCKGFSGLLSKEAAKKAKYQRLNRLVPRWVELMLETWDPPPRLIIMENVPRITARGKALLAEVHEMLGRAGYLVEQGYHDCGEVGGLAQHRRRFLLVGRNPERCQPILYKPPIKRVRGCGEVLGRLPIPTTPEADRYGRMHELPRISLMNMIRLALIPAGGDWRDIPGVLEEHQRRREVHKRHEVADWNQPTGTIAGSGSNGVANVADPRLKQNAFKGKYGVLRWDRASRTVIGGPSNGGAFIADPRMDSCNPNRFHNKYRVIKWDDAAKTVIGATRPGSGAPCVADPRVQDHHGGVLGVRDWDEASGTVTGGAAPTRGAFSVSDPRLDCAPRAGAYGVLAFEEPSGAIPGSAHIDNSRMSVADPRVKIAYDAGYKVLRWDEPAHTVAGKASCGTGAYQVADPREIYLEGIFVPWDDLLYLPAILGMDPKRPPKVDIVIISPDGCWHRPMTTLELAALQGLPVDLGEQPLTLEGKAVSRHRERIGNAVPVQAATAIARQMLLTLAETQAMSLELFPQSGGEYWVTPEERENAG